ncbi:MAG: D-sedoheptulose 7-phosphate isomerase [Bacteroidetes bacterium]|jgi:D-sedoheptulose 7-phosphate isomerase|nr:D-sedoheptulose 7-phosphate isomerase [Bacteroidota bacterium]
METIRAQFEEAQRVLQSFAQPATYEKIALAGSFMVESLKNGGKIISCGNGGSMCDAMHFAEELTGRYRSDRPSIAAISISDPSHLTCVGNDYGFDQVFARFIRGMGRRGDVLLGISTSGNSANVFLAMEAAKEMGMKVIGLTGKDGGRIAPLCDVEIRAPQAPYADRAQEIHIKVIHSLIGYIESHI